MRCRCFNSESSGVSRWTIAPDWRNLRSHAPQSDATPKREPGSRPSRDCGGERGRAPEAPHLVVVRNSAATRSRHLIDPPRQRVICGHSEVRESLRPSTHQSRAKRRQSLLDLPQPARHVTGKLAYHAGLFASLRRQAIRPNGHARLHFVGFVLRAPAPARRTLAQALPQPRPVGPGNSCPSTRK